MEGGAGHGILIGGEEGGKRLRKEGGLHHAPLRCLPEAEHQHGAGRDAVLRELPAVPVQAQQASDVGDIGVVSGKDDELGVIGGAQGGISFQGFRYEQEQGQAGGAGRFRGALYGVHDGAVYVQEAQGNPGIRHQFGRAG